MPLLPLLSIVVPCFNAEKFVAETIESVRAQTVTNWELLLINDGSRDGTQAVLESYTNDPRIRCLDLKSNCGISPARNLGTNATTGRYLMHLDADDLLPTTAFREHLNVLEHADVSYAGYLHFDKTPEQPVVTFEEELPADALLAILTTGTHHGSWWLPPGAVMVKRAADTLARQRFNVWEHHVPTASEIHYYACLYRAGAVFKSTKTVGIYQRKHPASDSATATFLGLSVGYMWLLDFWLKELDQNPELLRRKARLFEGLRIAATVESEFLVAHRA